MLDHVIEKNHLMPHFEQAGLDQTDIIFIKELIFGELTESTGNQVKDHITFYDGNLLFFDL